MGTLHPFLQDCPGLALKGDMEWNYDPTGNNVVLRGMAEFTRERSERSLPSHKCPLIFWNQDLELENWGVRGRGTL